MIKREKLIPNSTQIPNLIFDCLLRELPEAETKCLLYICRRTYGFHKRTDRIGLSQFYRGIVAKDGTRLDWGAVSSRSSAQRALANLKRSGLVLSKFTTKGTYYEINLNADIEGAIMAIKGLRKVMYLKKGRSQLRLLPRKKPDKPRLLGDKVLSKVGILKHTIPSKGVIRSVVKNDYPSVVRNGHTSIVRNDYQQNKGKQRETKLYSKTDKLSELKTKYAIKRMDKPKYDDE